MQDRHSLNLGASLGVAVREFPLQTGFADYLLYVDRKTVGVVEAKAVGTTLSGINHQSQKYGVGLPDTVSAWHRPLPFLYESTGVETLFTNGRDPEPRSRYVFNFHRPETLLEWVHEPETLRQRLRQMPELIDERTLDVLKEAGYDQSATDRARAMVESFRAFIEEHKDEITALQLLYSRPYRQRDLTYADIQELAELIQQPPRYWTTEQLWNAYAQLEQDKVRGVGAQRMLTDLISLVRHTLHLEDELTPYPDQIHQRYEQWLAEQAADGRTFTPEQRWWLDRIAQQIGLNLSVGPEDFDYGDFHDRGGRFGAMQALGTDWLQLIDVMNQTLAL